MYQDKILNNAEYICILLYCAIIADREVMSHPVVTFYTTEKVSTIVHVLKTEKHDGFPVVQRDDENVCIPFYTFCHLRDLFYSL